MVRYREWGLWRGRLQRAYAEAHSAPRGLQSELEDRNQSAAASLAEDLEETLPLHRLGVYGCSAFNALIRSGGRRGRFEFQA